MGALDSTPQQDENQLSPIDADDSKFGFHILKVLEGSPSDEAGFEPFFDYLVAIDGIRLNRADFDIGSMLRTHLNKSVTVTLFNGKDQSFRDVSLVPNLDWGGDGCLGCNIRFCSFEHAAEHVWHIMEVFPNSPALQAGLKSNTDYIIGTPELVIKDKNDLLFLVEQSIGKPLRFYVYNWETDKTREVSIIPDPNWGGEGSLGCDIGFGYLHRIPSKRSPSATANFNRKITMRKQLLGFETIGQSQHEETVATEIQQESVKESIEPLGSNQIGKLSGSNLMASITSLPDTIVSGTNLPETLQKSPTNELQSENAVLITESQYSNVDLVTPFQ